MEVWDDNHNHHFIEIRTDTYDKELSDMFWGGMVAGLVLGIVGGVLGTKLLL